MATAEEGVNEGERRREWDKILFGKRWTSDDNRDMRNLPMLQQENIFRYPARHVRTCIGDICFHDLE